MNTVDYVTADQVTVAEVLAELDREIALRRRVFPKWIAEGRITEAVAGHRIKCMVALREWLPRSLRDRHPWEPENEQPRD